MTDPLAVHQGDALERLRELPDESVQCCVTSPPYWGLRDYGTASWDGGSSSCSHRVGGQVPDGKAPAAIAAGVRPGADASTCLDCGASRVDQQVGLERTPREYVRKMVKIFREVRRVLRKDGVLWLNLGDSYVAQRGGGIGETSTLNGSRHAPVEYRKARARRRSDRVDVGLKHKDLVGIPWRVAFALQADGWWLRSRCIWEKPNPMPESVTDRPSRCEEELFLLTKSATYYYDQDAIREPTVSLDPTHPSYRPNSVAISKEGRKEFAAKHEMTARVYNPDGRNLRTVWRIATRAYADAHFATFPEEIPRRCILLGSPPSCCSRCGAARLRVTEDRRGFADGVCNGCGRPRAQHVVSAKSVMGGAVFGQPSATMESDGAVPCGASQTIGWKASCACDAEDGKSVVLDPFAGSGTTGKVAISNGRRAVLIELSAEYVTLIQNRNTTTIGMML